MAASTWVDGVGRLGAAILGPLDRLGDATRLALTNLLCLGSLSFSLKKVKEELARIGGRSLGIIAVTSFFAGMVLAVLVSVEMKKLGATLSAANILAIAFSKELAPIFTGLLMAGFAGSAITAEIGGMKLTSQMEGLRMLSLDVNRHFITPICLAATVGGFCLTALFDFIGIAGGYVVAVTQMDILFPTYHAATKEILDFSGVACGLIKGTIYGGMVGFFGCYAGLQASPGMRGLAEATRWSVVTAMVGILVSDYFLTKGLLFLLS